MRRILLSLLILLLPLTAAASPILEPFQLTYTAQYNGMDVVADRILKQHKDDSYELTTSAKNFFASIVETGTFRLNDDGAILNDRYQYRRSVLGSKKTENLVYDHNKQLAIYNSKDKQRQVPLDDPSYKSEPLSRLTYQLQLRRDLLNQSETLEYAVIRRGRLKPIALKKLAKRYSRHRLVISIQLRFDAYGKIITGKPQCGLPRNLIIY